MLRPDRLGKEIVAARVQRLEMFVGIAFAGQENDRSGNEGFALADDRGEFRAGAARHVEIHEDQVRVEPVDVVEHGERVGDHHGLHAGLAQDRFGENRLRAIVFDDHDAVRIGLVRFGQLRDAGHDVAGLRR